MPESRVRRFYQAAIERTTTLPRHLHNDISELLTIVWSIKHEKQAPRVVREFTTQDVLNPDFDPVPEPTRGEMAVGIMAVPVVIFLTMLAGWITG